MRWAASDVAFSIKGVDVRLAADTGTLVHMPKLSANTSPVCEIMLSARVFRADEVLCSLGFVSRVVQGSRVEVLRAAVVEFAEVVARKSHEFIDLIVLDVLYLLELLSVLGCN